MPNPFFFAGKITNPQHFVGREKELKRIFGYLDTAHTGQIQHASVLEETGCHPNWLQFTCREVVERLNDEDRFHAVREDVEWAIGRVPNVLSGDFKDMWEGRDSSDLMRNILKAVAKEDAFPASKLDKFKKQGAEFQKTMDFILRRDFLVEENDTYRFRSGLLRRWVVKQA